MIRAEIENFSGPYLALNTPCRDLPVSRFMLARCVMTVGQAGIREVFHLGFFRLAELLCMTYANTRIDSGNLILSDSFHEQERTERGAISYRLGMGLAKAVAEILLRIPWLVHLERVPGVVLSPTGTRRPPKLVKHAMPNTAREPDLIGFDGALRAHIFEAKGYSSGIPNIELQHAINQVSQVDTVNGTPPRTRVVSFFDTSQAPMLGRIIDPEGDSVDAEGVDVKADPLQAVAACYSFISEDIERWSNAGRFLFQGRRFRVLPIGTPNYYFGVDDFVFSMIQAAQYTHERLAEIAEALYSLTSQTDQVGFSIGLDGTILGSAEGMEKAGPFLR